MINPVAQTNITEFTGALRAYKAATQKDSADILNRAGRNVAFRAAQFTVKTTAAKIRADLMRDPNLRYALTAMFLKKQGKGMLPSPKFAEAVRRLIAKRAASANYLRASYALAIAQFGGTYSGKKFKGASGFANKATANRLIAEVVAILEQPDALHARTAEEVGIIALNKAVKFVAADMLEYSRSKLAQTAAQHSA